jgi:hypothetical protein
LISVLLLSTTSLAYSYDEVGCEKRFDFVTFTPSIQFPGKPVNISCILYPSSDVSSVNIVLTNPSGDVYHIPMNNGMNGTYTSQIVYETNGKYWFFIEADTLDSGIFQSDLFSFWIANSKEDRDGDDMSDPWELQNDLDPENPSDASLDSDSDGYTNREEFLMHTDPMRNDMIENAWYHLKEKQTYLFISFLLCFMLCFFSLFGMRRMMI